MALAPALLVAMSASTATAQTTVVWNGSVGVAWTSSGNWTPSRGANAWLTTDIAQFGSAGSQTSVNVGFQFFTTNPNTLSIAAIEMASTRTLAMTLGNNSGTPVAGTLLLNGATLGSDTNVILKNSSGQLLTLQPTLGATIPPMSIRLGNATTNQVIIDGSGDILISAVVEGAGRSLTKGGTGSGQLKLTGANTYSGGTVINNGTVYASNSNLADSATGTGPVTVNGGTLGGVGRAAGAVTVNSGGTLAPGESIGTLTLGDNVDLVGALSIEYDDTLGGQQMDVAAVVGDLDIAAGTLSFSDISMGSVGLSQPAYIFARYGTLTGGSFASVVNLPVGYTIDYAYNDGVSTNNIALVAAIVPEASAFLFVGLACGAGGIGAVVARRRRQKS